MFWNKRVYLDYAAGVAGLARGRSTAEGNPSSPHEEGRRAKKVLEDARTTIARLIEVQSDDIIFTSGATEANALAILGHVRALRAAGRKDVHVLYLPSAHASVVENAQLLAREGVSVEALPIRNFRVDSEALQKILRPETALVTMDAVCGETGVVWNTREVADVLKKFRTGERALLHVDASQTPLTEKISREHFGADLLTFDGSKVGVRTIGILVAHRTISLAPLYRGGGQERGLRSGSESPESSREFAAALCAAASGREAFCASAEKERPRLITAITSAIPNVHVNEGHHHVPNILNLSFPDRDTDYLVALLDEAGFAVSTRSACETDSEAGSRAVFALTLDKERARSTLRISWNADTRACELTRFAKALARAVAFIDSNARG